MNKEGTVIIHKLTHIMRKVQIFAVQTADCIVPQKRQMSLQPQVFFIIRFKIKEKCQLI